MGYQWLSMYLPIRRDSPRSADMTGLNRRKPDFMCLWTHSQRKHTANACVICQITGQMRKNEGDIRFKIRVKLKREFLILNSALGRLRAQRIDFIYGGRNVQSGQQACAREGIRLSRPGLLEVMALQDSSVNPRFLLSLPALQTQISGTTSPTGGLLPLPCLLSCVGFVSAHRAPLFLLPGCFLPILLFGFFSPKFVASFILCLAFRVHVWRFQGIDSGEAEGSR